MDQAENNSNTLIAEPKRIEWVDVFKGIAILLVVMGHTNSPFNGYIYLFHMAAFFFISGYTSNLEKKPVLSVVATKSYSILLPYVVVFFIFIFFLWFLNLCGLYDDLVSYQFVGLDKMLTSFFDHTIRLDWLGATWFLTVLFVIYIMQKLILLACKNNVGICYASLSIIVLFLGII